MFELTLAVGVKYFQYNMKALEEHRMPKLNSSMEILVLDIETAPNLVYTWGLWNQNVAINQIVKPTHVLCWGAKWIGKRGIHYSSIQIDPEGKDEEEIKEETRLRTIDMLAKIHALLSQADVVVTYNGRKFDIPRLNQEFKKHGFDPPAPYDQVDLYRVVKKEFNLPSNKLDWVVQYFDLGKKVKHPGMELWLGCMNSCERSWRTMERYNKGDIRITEKLYLHLLPWIKSHPNHGLFNGIEVACPNCGGTNLQRRGLHRTKAYVYQRYQCMKKGCGKWSRGKRNINSDLEPNHDMWAP